MLCSCHLGIIMWGENWQNKKSQKLFLNQMQDDRSNLKAQHVTGLIFALLDNSNLQYQQRQRSNVKLNRTI